MGAKYDFCAVFRGVHVDRNWHQLVLTGFHCVWRRFGCPQSLWVLDFVVGGERTEPYSAGRLTAFLPPGVNEIVAIQPHQREVCSVFLYVEGRYVVASATVEARDLDDGSKRVIFDQLCEALRPFGPSVLVTGEELEASESLVDEVLQGRSVTPRGIDLLTVFRQPAAPRGS